MRVVISVIAVVVVLAVLAVQPSAGEDRMQERLSALETRVAELEAVVFAEATPSDPSESGATGDALTPASQSTVGGTALDLLPTGEVGAVVVVAAGSLGRSQIPLVVRNNTDSPVAGVTVKVEAGDAGHLIAVGETLSNHALKPYLLQPSDVAIGFASLQGDVPPDATFTFTVDAEPAMSNFNADLTIEEASWLSDRIVGVARNPSDQAMGGTFLNLVCFAADGSPTRAEPASMQEDIAPGANASFQIGGGVTDVSGCQHFLVAATAHPK